MNGARRGQAAPAAQYVLLGGFAAVASGISSQGLTGFARANMALSGPWPYLLFLALDGAAGVCAVLLARRAARGAGSLAPRIAVWGLTGASAAFNFTHAPHRPDAPEAYAMMPVVAAVLFEFCLQETRSRLSARPGRRLSVLRWLHPAERVRVGLRMAADDALPAAEATRRVRVEGGARALYRLREALAAQGPSAGRARSLRARRAVRRAHAALARAGFADPAVAADILRNVQVLTMTTRLATLDYASAGAAHAAIASLITSAAPALGQPDSRTARAGPGDSDERAHAAAPGRPGATPLTQPAPEPAPVPEPLPVPPPSREGLSGDGGRAPSADAPSARDEQLIDAARQILADASNDGSRLSQAMLADRLRGQGWTIANDRLSWLACSIGLSPRRA